MRGVGAVALLARVLKPACSTLVGESLTHGPAPSAKYIAFYTARR
jgi:hypothetical protein